MRTFVTVYGLRVTTHRIGEKLMDKKPRRHRVHRETVYFYFLLCVLCASVVNIPPRF